MCDRGRKCRSGVGGAQQAELEDLPREPCVERRQAHALDFMVDVRAWSILAQVDDQGVATGTEHAMHLVERGDRVWEVLEGRLTEDEIEGVIGQRHVGYVTMTEVNAHASAAGVVGGDLYERVADVQPADAVGTELGQFDGRVARAGSDLEHRAAGWQLFGEPVRGLAVACLVAGEAGIPAGDGAFHLHAQVRLAARRSVGADAHVVGSLRGCEHRVLSVNTVRLSSRYRLRCTPSSAITTPAAAPADSIAQRSWSPRYSSWTRSASMG